MSQRRASTSVGSWPVPLLSDGSTIGVLCAAAREPRAFRDREVEALTALASHAAVTISNARLFASNREALDELEEANARLRQSAESRRRTNALRDRLTSLLIAAADSRNW